jgi:hypothetical protein
MNQNKIEQDKGYLVSQIRIASDRYTENEDFLIEYLDWPWWKRLFKGRKPLLDHIQKIHKKYQNE